MRGGRMLRFGISVVVAVMVPASALAQEPCVEVPLADDKCEAWVTTHDSPGGAEYGNDYVNETVVAPDGSMVYLAGGSRPSTSGAQDDQLIVALREDGGVAWEARHDGAENGLDTLQAAVLHPGGELLFVTGFENRVTAPSGYSNADLSVAAYDTASGEQVWRQTDDGSDVNGPYGYNEGRDVTLSPDGETVYVTGHSLGGGTVWDWLTVAYDARTGEELGRARWAGGDDELPTHVMTDGERIYVSGHQIAGQAFRAVTVAYETGAQNAPGAEVWRQVATGAGASLAMELSADGSLVYVGRVDDRVVAYDTADGTETWMADVPHNITDLATTHDGVVVTGTHVNPAQGFGLVARNFDYGTTMLDGATGTSRWTSTYGLPGRTEEEPEAVAVSPDGAEIYVTGYSSDLYYTYTPGFATVAYDADDGAQLWQARLRPQPAVIDADVARDAVVSADGERLYVSGTFNPRPDLDHGEIGTLDIAVAAYDL